MMLSTKKMEVVIGLLLTIGTLVSAAIVMLGGILYLLQYGGESVHIELLQSNAAYTNLTSIWQAACAFSPLGIIEIGVLALVATQSLRVALLVGFYAIIRDYGFVLISLFILIMLVSSFIWQR